MLLLLKLGDDRLKRFEYERGFVLRLTRMRDRCAPGLAHQLTVRTEQTPQQPGDADQTDKKRNDKSRKQKRTVDDGRAGASAKMAKMSTVPSRKMPAKMVSRI